MAYTQEQLAELLHTLFCEKSHTNQMEVLDPDRQEASPDKCYWYLESTLAEAWQAPDHKSWLDEAKRTVEEVGLNSAEATRILIMHVWALGRRFNQVLVEYPGGAKLAFKVIKLALMG